jgi:chromosome partitioning protein
MALSRILDENEEDAARAYIEVADFNLLPGSVIERARYREAHNHGMSFIESPGEDLNGTAAATLGALLTKIMRKHQLSGRSASGSPPCRHPSRLASHAK